MAFSFLVVLLGVSSLFSLPSSEAALTPDFYAKTCPQLDDIVLEIVHKKQTEKPATAAAALRIFFHDCMVEGCDGSLLIRSTGLNKAERDYDINLSLAGDGFDVVTEIKTKVEHKCPGVVSCSDILALATKALVASVGGPHYKILLGRKDGKVSEASRVEGQLARPNFTVDTMINMFQAKGFNIQEMVALVGGGHTIGFANCKEIAERIYNPQLNVEVHPSLLSGLQRTCANYTTIPGKSAFLDVIKPGVFDNTIFNNIRLGLAVLPSDHALNKDPRTKPFVENYANDQNLFFRDFTAAIEKVSLVGVKEGNDGEIRRRCDAVN